MADSGVHAHLKSTVNGAEAADAPDEVKGELKRVLMEAWGLGQVPVSSAEELEVLLKKMDAQTAGKIIGRCS